MAHILIGWELGAYSGHVRRILVLSEALEAAGHQVSLALQRLDALPAELRSRYPLWQAPLWRRLLVSETLAGQGDTISHADILARLGLDVPGMLSSLVVGWERIVAACAPDLIVAEYAPALLRAFAGRIPVIATGTGFDLPPADMDRFPSLIAGARPREEDTLLAIANSELRSAGRAPVASLPGMFAADAAVVCSFAEFDPFAAWRRDALFAPVVPLPIPAAPATRGGEAFVYWPQSYAAAGALWDGLARSGVPVRVHAPTLSDGERRLLEGAGLTMEVDPVPIAEIIRRSAILVSHGGAGITSCALVAGLPMIVVPVDLEKMVQANAVTSLGVGGWSAPKAIVADRFAADLRKLAADPDLAARAGAAAPAFRDRLERGPAAAIVEAVERLIAF